MCEKVVAVAMELTLRSSVCVRVCHRYIGQWFEGKRHGEGTFYYAAVNPVG